METTDRLRPHVLAPPDFDGAMALVAEAGWNQVVADWRLMCGPGGAVGVRETGGSLVATALAWPYAPRFGWISMVLVAESRRRRGLATMLLRDRIDWLRDRGMVPVLDATELGAPLYARIGFASGPTTTRWQGTGGAPFSGGTTVREANAADRSRIVALDGAVFGADRSVLLADFLDRSGSRAWVARDAEAGFVIARAGRRATQIGPLTAADEDAAIALLGTALAAVDGPVFLDALDHRAGLAAFIRQAGLTRQRSLVRMGLGETFDFDGNGRAMVIAGPEYG